MQAADFSYVDPGDPWLKRALIGTLEVLTGRNRIRDLYLAHQAGGWGQGSFFAAAVEALSLELRYDAARLAALPGEGPLLVIANHPFGVLDGIILCALIEKRRMDFLALTNSVLLRAPELRGRVEPIDFSDTGAARRANAASRSRALDHLKGGGCLLLFPAGAMATSPDRLGRQPAADLPWTPYVERLVRASQCRVAPVYFHGQNSRAFQIASHIHVNLRLALFFHEVRRRIGTPFPIEIGEVIDPVAIPFGSDRTEAVAFLREKTLSLGQPRPR